MFICMSYICYWLSVLVARARWSAGHWRQLQCAALTHLTQQQQEGGSSRFQQGPGVTKNNPNLWCNCWSNIVILWATRWFSSKLRSYIKKPDCQRPGNHWCFKLIDWCKTLSKLKFKFRLNLSSASRSFNLQHLWPPHGVHIAQWTEPTTAHYICFLAHVPYLFYICWWYYEFHLGVSCRVSILCVVI